MGTGAAGPTPPAVHRVRPRRSVPPVVETLLAPPGPRLTALGAGLMAVGAMLLTGLLLALLDAHAPVFFGVVFVLVCLLTAAWVRPLDAVTAPVAMPIAFAVGVLATGDGSGGATGHLMAAGTELALQAPWLYAGTMLAGGVALVRRLALLAVRHARRAERTGRANGSATRLPPAQRPPRP
ncbi:DUF6542 domain-containing protein [Streptomyces sp. NPDC051940]|uniref:DUF6542 domain-containing protein n=1 Tax=Streptomyces sp. NPDC051940 TaxID=3155675 RepID=UPI00341817AA